jgi:hypothetical protein
MRRRSENWLAGSSASLNAKLGEEKSLRPVAEFGSIDFPIFIPARKRSEVLIHLHYSCPDHEAANASKDERKRHREAVEKYLSEEMHNLDGFELFDEANRYDIEFPSGWKKAKKE